MSQQITEWIVTLGRGPGSHSIYRNGVDIASDITEIIIRASADQPTTVTVTYVSDDFRATIQEARPDRLEWCPYDCCRSLQKAAQHDT